MGSMLNKKQMAEEDILILHGTKDEVVSFDTRKQFADDNLIEFIPAENADHRFQNPAFMEIAANAVLSSSILNDIFQ